jgi:carboxypeptidase Taq
MSQSSNVEAYENLVRVFEQIISMGGISSILGRDMQTVMPAGSEENRLHQMVTLNDLAHEKIIDPRVSKWLDEAEANSSHLDDEQQVNLKRMRHRHTHASCLPPDLASDWARQNIEGERLHLKEMSNGDWQKILPFFSKTVDMARRVGEEKSKALGLNSAYDALLDQFSPGWTSKDIDQAFDRLEPFLKKLLPEVMKKQASEAQPMAIKGPFPDEEIRMLCIEMCKDLGLDFNRARLEFIDDHPSSGGTSDDTRITGRINNNDFMDTVATFMHEAGHGMYEQGTPKRWRYQPAGQSMGMDIHESQSLIMDFQLAKTREFLEYISDKAQKTFNRVGDASLSADNMLAIQTRVKPDLVRISMESGEITYALHIILRYRMEKEMIEGTLDPANLPDEWNRRMHDTFGLTPANNKEGCMQDIHWFSGAWGYFPSYNIGSMAAAQLFAAVNDDHPDLMGQIEKGDFSKLHRWLVDNIHSKGSLLDADELIKQATGKGLSADALMNHLNKRYLGAPLSPSVNAAPAGPNP